MATARLAGEVLVNRLVERLLGGQRSLNARKGIRVGANACRYGLKLRRFSRL